VSYLYPQACTLCPPPPRTPARPDPQVPRDAKLGPARWGKIGALYLYRESSHDDALFGLFDVEISLQGLPNGRARVEIYAIADGYQSGGALGADHPLTVLLMRGAHSIASFRWILPDIADGCADPISAAHDLDLNAVDWEGVDRIALDAARD
jgi:hypothetical protein